MVATPDLIFRRLERSEEALLAALIASAPDIEHSKSENFGRLSANPSSGEENWGLFIRGTLSGAASSIFRPGGPVEIRGLLLARDWWGMGLASWMLEQMCLSAELAGGSGATVSIEAAAPAVGEALADAHFGGPDLEDETYPSGIWKRPAGAGGMMKQ